MGLHPLATRAKSSIRNEACFQASPWHVRLVVCRLGPVHGPVPDPKPLQFLDPPSTVRPSRRTLKKDEISHRQQVTDWRAPCSTQGALFRREKSLWLPWVPMNRQPCRCVRACFHYQAPTTNSSKKSTLTRVAKSRRYSHRDSVIG